MTVHSSLAPKGNSVLGLSVTIAVHAVLAILVVARLHPDLPKILPEPVPVKLLHEAPKPELKPLPMPNPTLHPPVPVPVLVVPMLKVAEQPKPELPKIERPNAITLPPPAPPPAAPSPSEAQELDFQSKLMAHLNSLKRYPADAKRQGKMGVVMVRFRIDRHGRMLAYRIEQGSGHAILDEETTRLMQRADPFPAPPDSVPGTELEFLVPVQYKLG
ncbi:MAG TPA: TonB family protein [Magnetospirillaceae bacterium]|nr:TonB family protein [Magnetospirillaceae bacterium]